MTNHRSFLKWAGGKYSSLKHILPNLPPATRLIEPFAGSGVVFINSDYSNYLLGELNHDLVTLFKIVQKDGLKFIEFCKELFTENNNTKIQYYNFRKNFNSTKDPYFKSALFLYLNKHGYNGLCRYNSTGIFNVPFGKYKKPYFPLNELTYFFKKSQQATFIEEDFRNTFSYARTGDVIYCDPPYVPISKSSNFTNYTNLKFNLEAQEELARLAEEYSKKGITVIISNHDTDFTREQYKQSNIISFPVPRFISCNIGKRYPVRELLAVFKAE
jgi:DNA adenine methylase